MIGVPGFTPCSGYQILSITISYSTVLSIQQFGLKQFKPGFDFVCEESKLIIGPFQAQL